MEPQETDLLIPFEIRNIPAAYREYYRVKRNNLFSSIHRFPELWKYYVTLDAIWVREIDDLKPPGTPAQAFPLVLYINASTGHGDSCRRQARTPRSTRSAIGSASQQRKPADNHGNSFTQALNQSTGPCHFSPRS